MRCTFGGMWEYTDRQTDSIIKPKETKAYLTHLTMKWYSTESEIPKHQGSSVKKKYQMHVSIHHARKQSKSLDTT